jgi:hypothetical protein
MPELLDWSKFYVPEVKSALQPSKEDITASELFKEYSPVRYQVKCVACKHPACYKDGGKVLYRCLETGYPLKRIKGGFIICDFYEPNTKTLKECGTFIRNNRIIKGGWVALH